jgi:hypothetical protein
MTLMIEAVSTSEMSVRFDTTLHDTIYEMNIIFHLFWFDSSVVKRILIGRAINNNISK